MLLAACSVPAFGQALNTIYTIHTIAGGAANATLSALQTTLAQPEGIAVDAHGNVYVADPGDHRIRRITPDGGISIYAGTGVAGFSGDGSAAADAQLNAPYGICLDQAGNLYIADLGNARIRRVGVDGVILTFAGGGQIAAGPATDGTIATLLKLSAPRNVAADSASNLYFSDFSGHRVYKVAASGVVTTVAGSGVSGFAGDGGSAPAAKLAFPAGLAVDKHGVLYIADSGNKRVRRVYQGVIWTLGDLGRPGTVTYQLNAPSGLALDSSDNLYIQDGRATTLRLSQNGVAATLAIGGGDITFDSTDRAFTTGGHVVKRFTNGAATMIAGAGTMLFGGDGGPAANGLLNTPLGLWRDSSETLYIADSRNQRIRKIDSSGMLTTFAGKGDDLSPNGVQATTVRLLQPSSIAMDSRGNFYIADTTANRIRKVAADGSLSTLAGSDQAGYGGDGWLAIHALLNAPTGVAVDQNDSLYVADTGNGRIRKITADGMIYTAAGGGDLPGDGGPAGFAKLSSPTAVAFDRLGNFYISETGAARIRKVDRASIISTVPGLSLGEPRGLKVDPNGDLIVADSARNAVFRVSTTGQQSILAGTGARGFSGDGNNASSALLDSPMDVLLGVDGSILISDSGNNRIRKVTLETVVSTAPVVIPPAPEVAKLSILQAASLLEQAVAPGEIAIVFGGDFGALRAPQVLFDGRPAPILYAGSKQMNVQVPYGVAGKAQTEIAVVSDAVVRARSIVAVKASVPGIFTVAGGMGPASALNQDGSLNTVDNPARAGSIVVFYVTGDGQIYAGALDGQPGAALPTSDAVSLTFAGLPAEILYAGRAPGLIGVMQINARIPAASAPSATVPVMLKINGEPSQPGVTVAIQ